MMHYGSGGISLLISSTSYIPSVVFISCKSGLIAALPSSSFQAASSTFLQGIGCEAA